MPFGGSRSYLGIGFHSQLANLLVELPDALPVVGGYGATAENRRRVLQQLALPASLCYRSPVNYRACA